MPLQRRFRHPSFRDRRAHFESAATEKPPDAEEAVMVLYRLAYRVPEALLSTLVLKNSAHFGERALAEAQRRNFRINELDTLSMNFSNGALPWKARQCIPALPQTLEISAMAARLSRKCPITPIPVTTSKQPRKGQFFNDALA